MPDPKLQQVAQEIKGVLEKHDLPGIVFLASPTHGEFLIHPLASWLKTRFVEHEGGKVSLRVRCMKADFRSKEDWQEAMEITVTTLGLFRDMLFQTSDTFQSLMARLEEHVEIEGENTFEGPSNEPKLPNKS